MGSSPGRVKRARIVGSSPGRVKRAHIMGSNPGRVEPKAIKMLFAASPISTSI